MLDGGALRPRSGRDGFACAMLGSAFADRDVRLDPRPTARRVGAQPQLKPRPRASRALSNDHWDDEA